MSDYPTRPHEPYFTLDGELQLGVAADALEVQAPKKYKRQIKNYRILSRLHEDSSSPAYAEGIEPQRIRISYEATAQTQLDIVEGIRTMLADPNVSALRKVAAEALLDTVLGVEQYTHVEGSV